MSARPRADATPSTPDLDAGNVVVTVATYRRPDLLADLLESLRAAGVQRAVVVDNDGAGSARPVADRHAQWVAYHVEPEPGIAHARNRALDELPPDAAAFVCVDDDETVALDWFQRLLAAANAYSGGVFAGPVVSHFPPDAPRWLVDGGFMQRPRHATGPYDKLPATNNVLIRRSALELLDNPRFDLLFSLTGGSDSELFWRLRRAGVDMVWVDDAVVHELVPGDRVTLRWLMRRAYRAGNVDGRLRMRAQPRPLVVARGAAKVAVGAVALLFDYARYRHPRPFAVTTLFMGAGSVSSAFGSWVVEYQRS